MNKAVTVRDLLQSGSGNFDPMTLDTSELKELANSIPKDGNIDINNAEVLATKFLRGADICSELVSIATAYVGRTDAEKKKAYGYAATVKASQSNIKAAATRGWFADQDEDYIHAANKHAEAQAFLKWVNGKLDSFTRGHYLCKKILDRAYPHERMGGWNGNSPTDDGSSETGPAW